MATYVLVIIWIVSAIICYYIAKTRNVRPNLVRRLIVIFLGPLAIPLTFLAKPEDTMDKN